MIKEIDKYLIGVAIGIRYRANFSIEDQLGKIVDQILYNKNSTFDANVFPLVQNNVADKSLFNDKTGDSLLINNSNIIVEINFGKTFETKDYSTIIESFNKEIIEGILKCYKITEINRVGIIKRYLFKVEDLAKSFLNKTIGGTIDGVNDINLRFSKKFPVSDSLVQKEIYDYHNAIFNIVKKADRDEIFMSIDYQKYFEPFLSTASQIGFIEFAQNVDRYNNGNYVEWINKNYLLGK
ncbi:MAG: hypothetical protein WC223_13720 [Bacteroidales bacterium]|jgi:hypothetical protein